MFITPEEAKREEGGEEENEKTEDQHQGYLAYLKLAWKGRESLVRSHVDVPQAEQQDGFGFDLDSDCIVFKFNGVKFME